MNAIKQDPTQEPEFQKGVRHFVTTAPKTHDEMQAEKHKADSDGKGESEKSSVALANY